MEKPKTYQAAMARIRELEANFAGMLRQKLAEEKRAEQAEAALAAVYAKLDACPEDEIRALAMTHGTARQYALIVGWLDLLRPQAVQP